MDYKTTKAGQLSEETIWRRGLATRVATAYALCSPDVVASYVGGSCARGHADRFSDIEVGVLWAESPTEEDRLKAATESRAEHTRLFPFDSAERAWFDILTLGGQAEAGMRVEIANRTVEMFEHAITELVVTCIPNDSYERLASDVLNAHTVHGDSLLRRCREQVSTYPKELAIANILKHAQIGQFWEWEILIQRGSSELLITEICSGTLRQVLRTLLAVNRVYYFGLKWGSVVFSLLTTSPENLPARLRSVLIEGDVSHRALGTAALVEETFDIVEREDLGIDMKILRDTFRHRPVGLDSPTAGRKT